MKTFLKGLGLTVGAAALGYVGQHIGDVVNPQYAAILSAVIAAVSGWFVKSPNANS